MSPESSENYNQYPNQYNPEQRYMDIERGDVDPMALASNHPMNQFGNTNQQQQNQQQQQTAKPQVDPLELVKNMISTGFTPTQAQIASANNDLTGPMDSTSTWFAIFLQKLLRQARSRRVKR